MHPHLRLARGEQVLPGVVLPGVAERAAAQGVVGGRLHAEAHAAAVHHRHLVLCLRLLVDVGCHHRLGHVVAVEEAHGHAVVAGSTGDVGHLLAAAEADRGPALPVGREESHRVAVLGVDGARLTDADRSQLVALPVAQRCGLPTDEGQHVGRAGSAHGAGGHGHQRLRALRVGGVLQSAAVERVGVDDGPVDEEVDGGARVVLAAQRERAVEAACHHVGYAAHGHLALRVVVVGLAEYGHAVDAHLEAYALREPADKDVLSVGGEAAAGVWVVDGHRRMYLLRLSLSGICR